MKATTTKNDTKQSEKDGPITDVSGAVSYTIKEDNPWFAVLWDKTNNTAQSGQTWVTLEQVNGSTTWNVSAAGEEGENLNSSDKAQAFGTWLVNNKPSNASNISFTKNGDEYKAENLDEGYYLVTSSLGSELIVATTNVEMYEKNNYPKNDKKVLNDDGSEEDSTTASIGDTVTYHVNVTVPASANKDIKVVDIISSGLNLNADVTGEVIVPKGKNFIAPESVSGWNKDQNNDKKWSATFVADEAKVNSEGNVDTTPANNTFTKYTVTIPENLVSAIAAVGADNGTTFKLSYTAKVNKNAVIGDEGNPNKAHIEYQNYVTPNKEADVKTYRFDLVKTGEGSQVISGAQFQLFKATGSDAKNDLAKSGNAVQFVKTAANGDVKYDTYRVASQDEIDDSNVTKVETIDAGYVRVEGLGNGTYALEETKAPDGYNKLTKLVEVVINNGNKDAVVDTKSETYEYTSGGVRVENQKGSILPSTGGIGTMIFYLAGGILVIGAAALLITKKKRNA